MSEIHFDGAISLGTIITIVMLLVGLVGIYYQLRERFTAVAAEVKLRVSVLEAKFEERRHEDDRRYEQIAESLRDLRKRP